MTFDELSDRDKEELAGLPPVREFYGEYKHGIFGSMEQISLCLTDGKVEGRGFLRDIVNHKKFTISDFSYSMTEFIGLFPKEFDGKTCCALCPKLLQKTHEVYFPGILVPVAELGRYFKLYSVMPEYKELLRSGKIKSNGNGNGNGSGTRIKTGKGNGGTGGNGHGNNTFQGNRNTSQENCIVE